MTINKCFFVDFFSRIIVSNNRFKSLFDDKVFEILDFFIKNNDDGLFLNFIFLKSDEIFKNIKSEIFRENLLEELIKEIKIQINNAEKEEVEYIKQKPNPNNYKILKIENGNNTEKNK